MTKEEYIEMVKDIINNGAEYECMELIEAESDWWSDWRKFDVTKGYNPSTKYRKKQPKTWLEENYPISKERDDNDVPYGTSEVDAIKDFCEEFIGRVIRAASGSYKFSTTQIQVLKNIAKEMGVE